MWGKRKKSVKPGHALMGIDSLEATAQANENWAEAVLEGGHHCDRQTAKCGLLPDKKGRGYCVDFLEAVEDGEYYKNPDGTWAESGAQSAKARNQSEQNRETCPFCGGRLCPPKQQS